MRLPDLNDLIQDLQLAKQIAIEDRNPNAMIMATMAQARIIGIDRPQLTDDEEVQPVSITVTYVDGRNPERLLAESQ